MAGLGILSSLAIPNFIKYLDYAQSRRSKIITETALQQIAFKS